jgi:hypothetical protein
VSLDRTTLKRRFPLLHFWLRSVRYSLVKEQPDATTARLIGVLCGRDPRVLWGPFAGMRYGRFACGSGLLPKIAGTYELELHEAIAESLARAPRYVINIGAGEGYYAVGYARALPGRRIFAFDTDPLARQRLRKLARLNGVETRLAIGTRAAPADLARLVDGPRSLVVCDCEGCETQPLDPQAIPGLHHTDLLVECHDFIAAGTTELLEQKFGPSRGDNGPRHAPGHPAAPRLATERKGPGSDRSGRPAAWHALALDDRATTLGEARGAGIATDDRTRRGFP